jgi:hypothetical protein
MPSACKTTHYVIGKATASALDFAAMIEQIKKLSQKSFIAICRPFSGSCRFFFQTVFLRMIFDLNELALPSR